MKINQLTVKPFKNSKRVGRGISAGQGKTAGRGTKGQKARTGKKLRATFEGGQNPLARRSPKLAGFTSHKKKIQVVYTDQLNTLKDKSVDNLVLAAAGFINDAYSDAKLIVRGDLTSPINITISAASAGAIEMVQKAGGSVTIAKSAMRESKRPAKKQD